MPSFDLAKVVALVFLGAVLQVSVFSSVEVLGGTPDLVLLTLVGVALLRGPVYGAAAGFAAGLVVDALEEPVFGPKAFEGDVVNQVWREIPPVLVVRFRPAAPSRDGA
jgi:rod shape-determining protein MreD